MHFSVSYYAVLCCAVQVSGFSFWSYMRNALQFEGTATLPKRWLARTARVRDKLVLAGDFPTLAHAQKVRQVLHDTPL